MFSLVFFNLPGEWKLSLFKYTYNNFKVFSCSNVTKFKAKFSVFNTRNDEIAATVYAGTQQVYFE